MKERFILTIKYKKLWKLLIEKELRKKDLQKLTGISNSSITKLANNGTVRTDILDKICLGLNCKIEDIMEVIKPSENESTR